MDSEYNALQSPETDNEDEAEEDTVRTPVDCFRCRKETCKRCCCGFNNCWKVLIVGTIVTIYLILGGLFFSLIERPGELMKIQQAQADRTAAINAFEESLTNFTRTVINLTNLTDEAVTNFTNLIVAVASELAIANQTLPIETDPIWDYASAVFFASTVITTIGYGTIAPGTDGGQILFIFYALIGIPIALIFLSTIGAILSDWLDAALAPLVKHKGKLAARAIGFLVTGLLALIFFIIIPAAIFYSVEKSNNWTYLNSVYYCFVTLTTVGFGDFVPGIEGSSIIVGNPAVVGLYKIITVVWLWIGLAIIATLISETQGLFEAIGKAIRKSRIARRKTAKHTLDQVGSHEELATVASADTSPTKSPPPVEENTGEQVP